MDEVLEQRCLDEMNADRIKTIIRECDTIWGDKGLSVEEKINRLVPYKIEIYNLVSMLQLPDELVRADTNISILMATILYYAQSVEKCEEIQNKNTQASTSIGEISRWYYYPHE